MILLLIIIYIGTCVLSIWLMDIDNPKSYWYCEDDEDRILPGIFAGLPLINILFALIGNSRMDK